MIKYALVKYGILMKLVFRDFCRLQIIYKNCYIKMRSTGTKLWKQIGNSTQKKTPLRFKSENQNQFKNGVQKGLGQQIVQTKSVPFSLDNSFGRLQISEIKEKVPNQCPQWTKNKTKHSNTLDGLENMLGDIYENQQQKNSLVNENDDNNSKQNRKKYIEACVMFKNILAHLKEQIKNIQRSTNKQREKMIQIQDELMQNYNKKSIQLQNRIAEQVKQNQINVLRIGQLSQVELQKNLIQQKLKLVTSQYQTKIRDLLQNSRKQRQKHQTELQSMNNQKVIILKENSQLSQKILDLQQNLNSLKDQNLKIVQEISFYHNYFEVANKNKTQQSGFQNICSSPVKKLKSQQTSVQNFFKQPQMPSTTKKLSFQSGIYDPEDEQDERRKTFSHFSGNKLKSNASNVFHGPNPIQQQSATFSSFSRTEKHLNISQSKRSPKLQSKYQDWNEQENPVQNYHSTSQSLNSSHVLAPNKMKHHISNSENRKKSYDINLVGEKLIKMRLEIEGEIRHLKSSMSTNT